MIMKLSDADCGKEYYIRSIDLNEQVTHRLEILGMTVGTKAAVLNMKNKGPVIVRVRGTRFAIGRKFAEGINVGGAE